MIGLITTLPMLFIFLMIGLAMGFKEVPMGGMMGYRTNTTRNSKELWDYANKTCGRLFILAVIISLIINIGIFIFTKNIIGLTNGEQAMLSMSNLFVIVIFIAIAIFITERGIRKRVKKN